jgi:two-component system, chemotaxis family, response regulator Rcp1
MLKGRDMNTPRRSTHEVETETIDTTSPFNILLVEDNPGDVLLAREALAECCVPAHIHVVPSSDELDAFLQYEGKYFNASIPDLILLDLNLPGRNGPEILKLLKSDQKFRMIPVIILTTSADQGDVLQSYMSYANSYIVKPLTFEQYVDVLCGLLHFWLKIAELPTKLWLTNFKPN